MANAFAVCLLTLSILYCSNLSWARNMPTKCGLGPRLWCVNIREAADCGAVDHCHATVWSKQTQDVRDSRISDKFVRFFRQLIDIKDLINSDYVATRLNSICQEVKNPLVSKACQGNTQHLEEYIHHLLKSNATPETMCVVIGMCFWEESEKANLPTTKTAVEVNTPTETLLGSSRCTWGPSYWCSNFSTGHECKSTHHCATKVWPKMELPEDKDDICKICTDMVKQARDQLQSNETQEELKEVFEGSCKLIPIKLVAKECMKLADDFVPELVETLASEMNPQQVCAVAGLCNNARIDQLIDEYNAYKTLKKGCDSCQKTVGAIRKKFDDASYDDFLVGLLQACGKMGSLSDSCSILVFKYYENILEAVKKDLTPTGVCHLSGQCAYRYHSHDLYSFVKTDVEDIRTTDDVPCEFCEQLVVHLRDVLTANTTQMQFDKILHGLCKQTGKFKSECLAIADEYADLIYSFLVKEMKPAMVCQMMGICGKREDVPVAPLLPHELAVKVLPSSKLIGAEEAKIARVPISKQENVRIMGTEAAAQLPIERMFVNAPVQGKPVCSFCQYFLHYLQVEISDADNEEKIKAAVEKACDTLPRSVNAECKEFVTSYGPAVIALLVQQIDPASVCPALGLCPQTAEVKRVHINAEKSNCPLCLFAVEQLETMLKNNRSEDNIRQALDNLCSHLSTKLRTQCVDFVDMYSKQLVEMLIANMDSQEICVFLKLCKDEAYSPLKQPHETHAAPVSHPGIDRFHENPWLRGDRNNLRKKANHHPAHFVGDIETNEIPDNTVNGRTVKTVASSQKTVCVVCEFVLKEIDDEIKDKHNEDEIKKIVHSVCKRMPKSVRPQCDQFVEKYADLVISLLAQELDADEVCQELKLCDPSMGMDHVREEILDCAVCETVAMAVKKVITNDRVDRNIVHIVEKSCGLLPAKYNARCHTMMEVYGDSVIHLIENYGVKGVCQKIGMCTAHGDAYVKMHGRN